MCIRLPNFHGTVKRCLVARNYRFVAGVAIILCLFSVRSLATAAPVAMGATPQPWVDRPPTVDPTFGLPMPVSVRHPARIPAWIWAAHTRNNQVIYLRQSFKLATVPRVVKLYAAAENYLEIFLNGEKITTTFQRDNKLWHGACELSVSELLHPGDNTVAIRAANATGSAGVILWMRAGSKTLCLTDGQWHMAVGALTGAAWTRPQFDDSTWALAVVQAPYGERPRGQITPWPSCGYLAHLYFQPLHVTALHGGAAFKGLSAVAAALTPGDI
ncbi:MAG: hypothetical protein ACP5I8_14255, partial [Phycisphaerae bacterium]